MLASESTKSPPYYYLTRVGAMGHVGRFRKISEGPLQRLDLVVCRTSRGLEVGSILGPSGFSADSAASGGKSDQTIAGLPTPEAADGRILRKLTPEDRLLWEQLRRLGAIAQAACETWLQEQQLPGTLLEVEPLLDGRTLYFHFLSEVSPEVQAHLDELVAVYEAEVRRSQFARLLEHGCGPGCGTEKAVNGCGTGGGCAVCSVAARCGVR